MKYMKELRMSCLAAMYVRISRNQIFLLLFCFVYLLIGVVLCLGLFLFCFAFPLPSENFRKFAADGLQ